MWSSFYYPLIIIRCTHNQTIAFNLKYAMSAKHLHIWPRGKFMMIALPNDDHTFTGNIFAPFETLNKLKTPQQLLNFYTEQFPDLLELIGREKLVKDYFEREPKTLISIKVNLIII